MTADPRKLAEEIATQFQGAVPHDCDIDWTESRLRAFLQEQQAELLPGGRLRTLCPECGPNVAIDEEGCCATCGATATGRWLEAHPSLGAQQAELLGELAVKTEALSALEELVRCYQEEPRYCGQCMTDEQHVRYEEWSTRTAKAARDADRARATLSGETGKLAAAVIQAAIDFRLTNGGIEEAGVLSDAVDALLAAAGKEGRNG